MTDYFGALMRSAGHALALRKSTASPAEAADPAADTDIVELDVAQVAAPDMSTDAATRGPTVRNPPVLRGALTTALAGRDVQTAPVDPAIEAPLIDVPASVAPVSIAPELAEPAALAGEPGHAVLRAALGWVAADPLPQPPYPQPPNAQADDHPDVEISIGEIHIRVDSPVPEPVAFAAPSAPAAASARPVPDRSAAGSGLARRALRRI